MSNQWKGLQGDQDARISWQRFKALILTMQKNIKKNMFTRSEYIRTVLRRKRNLKKKKELNGNERTEKYNIGNIKFNAWA